MRNNLIYGLHAFIIAVVVFNFVGCGYKTPPVYVKTKVVLQHDK